MKSLVRRTLRQSSEMRSLTLIEKLRSEMEASSSSKEQSIREAVLLSFCGSSSKPCLRINSLSKREWQRLLQWLDISGLALYFFGRMVELEQCDLLPRWVQERLQQNLQDNQLRTHGMIAESVLIQEEFQGSGLSYSILKGLSLFPNSVLKLELRHQVDLDFLVAEKDISEARKILERQGYRLYAVSGRSWEFKKNETPGASLKDLYKDLHGRSVELHVEAEGSDSPRLLERVEEREFYGIAMPVLSPVDLLLGQGMHAYKHICSEFSRTAHLLEFRRHVFFRREDEKFWTELQIRVGEDPRTSLGLAVVILLITQVIGDFAPVALTRWTVQHLPLTVRLWIKRYGRRVVFGDFPGSKLYLLLQGELESAGIPAKRSLRQSLLPRRLPPLVIRAPAQESLSGGIRRYRMQLQFIFLRLRFHFVEGLRYSWESYCWQQYRDGHTQ